MGISSLAHSQPKESAAALIERILEDSGTEAAAAKLRHIESDPDGRYAFNETELDDLGKRLLREQEVSLALHLFDMTADKFPDSWKAHESLGESYYFMGMRVGQALAGYQKASATRPTTLARRSPMTGSIFSLHPKTIFIG